jgi:glycosyltransferase involved in cell wall biosynthesis
VLFVSRERHRLPLDGAQKRKWDAIGERLDYRVLASGTGSDPRFRLAPPLRALDGPLYYLALPFRIARELRAFRPDAAIVQGVHELTAFLLARAATRSRAKAILDLHGDWRTTTRLYGSPLRRLLNPLNDALAPFAVRRADAIRTVSNETTALVRSLGREPTRQFVAYVDAQAFLEPPLQPLPERPRAVSVAVLERYKAFDTLAAAWRLAAPRVPQATLRIVGEGTLSAEAERLVADLPEQTEWTPRLAPEQVAAAMDDAWLLALPSRSEGLPRVALEAACRGRAIVGGDRAGIPEVVRDGENGLLVDPEDPEQVADALVRILSDRALAERLGAAARRTGEEWGATPEVFAERLAELVGAAQYPGGADA